MKDFGVLAVNNYYIILLIFLRGMYKCDDFFNLLLFFFWKTMRDERHCSSVYCALHHESFQFLVF
jgi:hypothetical protein